ncbi:MAG TPA: hypothetical protein VG184_09850 [Acidimicrobiales bacterium]|nr:hypothetical protein [Acidimicrobiales bacterium]
MATATPGDADAFRDRESEINVVFTDKVRAHIAQTVTPELVEEHRRNPVGHHSAALAQVLAYFRQRPTAAKLAVVAVAPGREWVVIRLSGRPGCAHEPVDGAAFFSREEDALHAVLLRRLGEAGVAVGDG